MSPTWQEDWGRRLRAERLNRHLRQEDLAAQVGRHQTTISDWEMGRATPGDEDKVLLVEALGCTFADLFPWPDVTPRRNKRSVA